MYPDTGTAVRPPQAASRRPRATDPGREWLSQLGPKVTTDAEPLNPQEQRKSLPNLINTGGGLSCDCGAYAVVVGHAFRTARYEATSSV